ncbi:MAG: NUDIX domain-containing protein [Aeriscardovia sp.]|nr:NUDIX domain-containing protein [Aeriscardovia sp.]
MASLRTKAAGVVLQEGGCVAVVHRGLYRDWSLPKGQIEEGESVAHCALRETEEESGYSLRLLGFLGSTSYKTRFGEKSVFYFFGEKIPRPLASKVQKGLGTKRWKDSETEEVRFVGKGEAIKLLSYGADRNLVSLLPPLPSSVLFWANPNLVPPSSMLSFSRTLSCFAPERIFFSPSALSLASFYSKLCSAPIAPLKRFKGPEGRFLVLSRESEFDLEKFGVTPSAPGIYCSQIGKDGAFSVSLAPFSPFPSIPKRLY